VKSRVSAWPGAGGTEQGRRGLKLLDGDADKAFLATREELKGDLLVQLGSYRRRPCRLRKSQGCAV
jgi:hypothetical protein